MKVLKTLLALVSVLLVVSCSSNKNLELSIVHTNDTHARLSYGKYDGMGFPAISAKVAELRTENPNLLFLDAGDIIHGAPIVTISKGQSILKLLDEMKYDAIAIGNHEFDYGQDRLKEIISQSSVPFLSANIKKGNEMYAEPYIIKKFDNVKVGIFGLTTPETYVKSHPKNVEGLTFEEPAEVAKRMVKKLKKERCDIIIALAHLGIDEETKNEWKSTYVAETVDGIDVIVDGHSHSEIPEGARINDTLIVQAMEYDKALGIVNLSLEKGKVTVMKASYYTKEEAQDAPKDESITAIIDSMEKDNETITSKVIGKTSIELDGEKPHVRAGETNLGNLITDSFKRMEGVDGVITNGGGIRSSIGAGDITVGDVITVLPFGNVVIVKALTGKDVKAALEHGVDAYPETAGKFPHVAGITFTLDSAAEAGNRVKDLTIGGEPVDMNKIYNIATNDFMAAGGDGYEMFKGAKEVKLYKNMDEMLVDYIQEIGTVTEESAKVEGRINVI